MQTTEIDIGTFKQKWNVLEGYWGLVSFDSVVGMGQAPTKNLPMKDFPTRRVFR